MLHRDHSARHKTSEIVIAFFIEMLRIPLVAITLMAATGVDPWGYATERSPNSDVASCTPLPSGTRVGPVLTVAQAEGRALVDIQAAPENVPRVPFGFANADWLSLKTQMMPGDTVHQFDAQSSEGYLILRGDCLLGELVIVSYQKRT